MMELKRVRHETVYHGRTIDLIVDEIEYPQGGRSVREVARHPGGAVCVPLFEDGSVMFVRQYRYPIGDFVLELPAGKMDPGESPEAAAIRELEEETGWNADSLEHLTSILTTPGFCDEVLHIYLATNLRRCPGGPRRQEGEEQMTLHTMALSEAIAMIENGRIRDGKTIVGLLLAEKRWNNKGNEVR